MTSMQPTQSEQGSSEPDLFGINLLHMDGPAKDSHAVSFGSRLHAAREARGLDIETCAHTLKLPARVLRQLEHDTYDDTEIGRASCRERVLVAV